MAFRGISAGRRSAGGAVNKRKIHRTTTYSIRSAAELASSPWFAHAIKGSAAFCF